MRRKSARHCAGSALPVESRTSPRALAGRRTDNTDGPSPWILLPVAIRRGEGGGGWGATPRGRKGEVTRGEWIGSSV